MSDGLGKQMRDADSFSPSRISRRADDLKLTALTLLLALPSILDPGRPILQWELQRLGLPADADIPVMLIREGEEEHLQVSAREILTKATHLDGEIVGHDLMSTGMIMGALRIGDMIIEGHHMRQDVPLLQFARHFRNACAHGDRWYFRRNEPQSPAHSGSVVLSKDLPGKRATWDTVGPRDYFEFLDAIRTHFMGIAVDDVLERTSAECKGRPVEEIVSTLEGEMQALNFSGSPEFTQRLHHVASIISRGGKPYLNVMPPNYPHAAGAD